MPQPEAVTSATSSSHRILSATTGKSSSFQLRCRISLTVGTITFVPHFLDLSDFATTKRLWQGGRKPVACWFKREIEAHAVDSERIFANGYSPPGGVNSTAIAWSFSSKEIVRLLRNVQPVPVLIGSSK